MKKAAAYARVSGQKQSETSLDTQLEEIQRFAKSGGLHVVETYVDKITASGEKDRPQFNTMIERAFAGHFEIILVYKQDRFHRDNVQEQLLLRQLESRGIYVVSTTEKLDTTTPAGRLQRWIMSGINRFYLENLQQEIYDKTTKVIKKGYWLGGTPPYGYKTKEIRDPEASRNRKILVLNEEEAPIIRLIYKWRVDGLYHAKIAERLNEQGIPSRSGKAWSSATVYDMIRNKVYAGYYVHRKGTKQNRHAERSDTIEVEGAVEAIVDLETWEKAQPKGTKIGYRHGKKTDLLQGLVYCADCNTRMVLEGSKYPKYVCGRWKRFHDVQCISSGQAKTEKYVLSYIQEVVLKDLDFKALVEEINQEAEKKIELTQSRIMVFKDELQEIESTIEAAVEAILARSPLAQELEKRSEKLQARKKEIMSELHKIQKESDQFVTEDEVRERYNQMRKLLEGTLTDKKHLIANLIQRIEVHPGGYIKIIDR